MDNSSFVTSMDSFNNLSEEVTGNCFLQDALLCDEIKQVFDRFWAFHNNYETVGSLVIVEDFDDSLNMSHFTQEKDFQWDFGPI